MSAFRSGSCSRYSLKVFSSCCLGFINVVIGAQEWIQFLRNVTDKALCVKLGLSDWDAPWELHWAQGCTVLCAATWVVATALIGSCNAARSQTDLLSVPCAFLSGCFSQAVPSILNFPFVCVSVSALSGNPALTFASPVTLVWFLSHLWSWSTLPVPHSLPVSFYRFKICSFEFLLSWPSTFWEETIRQATVRHWSQAWQQPGAQ